MNFNQWISENQNVIQFTTFANDGTIVVYINGQKYTYLTDSYYHDKWKKMKNFKPWHVLNDIKAMVKNGSAQLL